MLRFEFPQRAEDNEVVLCAVLGTQPPASKLLSISNYVVPGEGDQHNRVSIYSVSRGTEQAYVVDSNYIYVDSYVRDQIVISDKVTDGIPLFFEHRFKYDYVPGSVRILDYNGEEIDMPFAVEDALSPYSLMGMAPRYSVEIRWASFQQHDNLPIAVYQVDVDIKKGEPIRQFSLVSGRRSFGEGTETLFEKVGKGTKAIVNYGTAAADSATIDGVTGDETVLTLHTNHKAKADYPRRATVAVFPRPHTDARRGRILLPTEASKIGRTPFYVSYTAFKNELVHNHRELVNQQEIYMEGNDYELDPHMSRRILFPVSSALYDAPIVFIRRHPHQDFHVSVLSEGPHKNWHIKVHKGFVVR